MRRSAERSGGRQARESTEEREGGNESERSKEIREREGNKGVIVCVRYIREGGDEEEEEREGRRESVLFSSALSFPPSLSPSFCSSLPPLESNRNENSQKRMESIYGASDRRNSGETEAREGREKEKEAVWEREDERESETEGEDWLPFAPLHPDLKPPSHPRRKTSVRPSLSSLYISLPLHALSRVARPILPCSRAYEKTAHASGISSPASLLDWSSFLFFFLFISTEESISPQLKKRPSPSQPSELRGATDRSQDPQTKTKPSSQPRFSPSMKDASLFFRFLSPKRLNRGGTHLRRVGRRYGVAREKGGSCDAIHDSTHTSLSSRTVASLSFFWDLFPLDTYPFLLALPLFFPTEDTKLTQAQEQHPLDHSRTTLSNTSCNLPPSSRSSSTSFLFHQPHQPQS